MQIDSKSAPLQVGDKIEMIVKSISLGKNGIVYVTLENEQLFKNTATVMKR
jgi:hypothetical protein